MRQGNAKQQALYEHPLNLTNNSGEGDDVDRFSHHRDLMLLETSFAHLSSTPEWPTTTTDLQNEEMWRPRPNVKSLLSLLDIGIAPSNERSCLRSASRGSLFMPHTSSIASALPMFCRKNCVAFRELLDVCQSDFPASIIP